MPLFIVTTKSHDARSIVANNAADAILRIQSKYGAIAVGVECVNEHRIGPRQTLTDHDVTLESLAFASSVPACCDQGCEVEPDGTCEHDCPSVLMAMGLI